MPGICLLAVVNRKLTFLVFAIISAISAYVIYHGSSYLTQKFFVTLSDERLYGQRINIASCDLDGDGEVEILQYNRTLERGYSTISIFNTDKNLLRNKLKRDINIFHQTTLHLELYVDDINKNGTPEVYYFYFNNDSLFVESSELRPETNVVERYFISEVEPTRDNLKSLTIYGFKTVDVNNDTYNELAFTVNGGFSIQPRKVVFLDIRNKKIYSTTSTLIGLVNAPVFLISKKEKPVYAVNSVALNNTASIPGKYKDDSSYLIVYKGLSPLFPPVPNNGHGSSSVPLLIHKDRVIVGFDGVPDSPYNIINVYSFLGERLDTRILNSGKSLFFPNLDENHFGVSNQVNGNLKIFNSELNVIWQENYGEVTSFIPFSFNDQCFFLLHDSKRKEFIVLDNDFTNSAHFKLAVPAEISKVNVIDKNSDQLLLTTPNSWHVLSLKWNPVFPYRYAVVSVIILFVFITLLFVRFVSGLYFFKQRQDRMNKMTQLQLEISGAKIDTHFTFNALNNIEHMYRKGYGKDASNYMKAYSNLIRMTVSSSSQVITSLREELLFIKTYLELQSVAGFKKLNYMIDFEDDIDLEHIQVPKQLIFNQVENAFKYGIHHQNGQIRIEVTTENPKQVLIRIIDTGAKNNLPIAASTKMGASIDKEVTALFYQITKKRIVQKMEDSPNGGRVVSFFVEV